MTPKPGYATTEFWATIIVHVLALIALVHPGIDTGTWTQPLAVIAAGLGTAFYSLSRAHVKKASLLSTASAVVQSVATSAATNTAAALSPATVGEVGQVTDAALSVVNQAVGQATGGTPMGANVPTQ